MIRFAISCLVFGLATLSLRAQFYAPDVCMHDAAQRLFVVEAARVLAWIENKQDPKVADVRWEVDGSVTGETEWRLSWLNAEGEELRAETLSYGEKELTQGGDFYRRIWKVLRKQADMKEDQRQVDSELLLRSFWPDPNSIGVNRMSGVLAAVDWARNKKPIEQAADAVALAGILMHSAHSILVDSCQLDYLLLARSAAWLCMAEELAGVRLEPAWATLMYLAGREKPAAALWQSVQLDEKAPLVARWWDEVLRKRPVSMRELVEFAAEKGNAQWGLTFLLAHLQMDNAHATELSRVIALLYGKQLNEWHDLGPVMIRTLGVSGPQNFYGLMPTLSRVSWLQTLGHVASPEAGGQRSDITEDAASALQAVLNDGVNDSGCKGLVAAAPLILLGEKIPARNSMAPIGSASTDDLLVYGWDMTVHTMEAWMRFMNSMLGVASQAQVIRDVCMEAVPSLGFWVDVIGQTKAVKYPGDWRRLEFFQTDKLARPAVYWVAGGTGDAYSDPVPERPPLRNWLKRGSLGFFHAVVINREGFEKSNFWQWVDLLVAEGGECHAVELVRFLDRPLFTAPTAVAKVPAGVLERLRKETPNATALHRYARVLAARAGIVDDFMDFSQELERSFWQAPGSDALAEIFEGYIRANATDAAKRFYGQVLPMMGNSLSFSNFMATRRWVLAWWDNDADAMAAAAQDAPSFSGYDIQKQVMQLILTDEISSAQSLLEAGITRYPQRDPGKPSDMMLLNELLPDLTVLAKLDHPSREKVLNSFGDRTGWLTLRFALAKKFDLSEDDGIRFLGGKDQDGLVGRALCAYWAGDKALFNESFIKANAARPVNSTPFDYLLLFLLYNEINEVVQPREQPDLKGEDARTLDQIVRGR
jgi:hypothetical protein